MAKKVIHFTLGPVQSFVAQARRTRDLWSGSFLLSYLSGQAMKSMIDAGARVEFPTVQNAQGQATDPLLKAIFVRPQGHGPSIGSIPNRFKVICPDNWELGACLTVASGAASAIRKKWTAISTEIWNLFLKDIEAKGNETRSIWDRQISNFWDINFVVGETSDGSDSAWLDLRKNWRTHQLSPEEGDHCSLMGSDFQELSGYIRSNHKAKQDEFWQAFINQKGKIRTLDFSENERLCAIALVKRLFPLATEKKPELIGWTLDVRNWPSTTYLAAVDWLSEAYKFSTEAMNEADAYAEFIRENRSLLNSGAVFGEYHTNLECLNGVKDFAKLDGSLYFKDAIANKNTVQIKDEAINSKLRQQIIDRLKKLEHIVGSSASPYFAVLLMDGDKLGALLQQDPDKTTLVSSSLDLFSQKVQEIVDKHSGVTVYAGGDDVLALLPMSKVLKAAGELRQHYLHAFKTTYENQGKSVPKAATLSGAIVFANNRMTLRATLQEAHHMLDEVAKEQNGRDSLAISVLTGGGRKLNWVSAWEIRNAKEKGTELVSDIIQGLNQNFIEEYSSQFFYNLRERFGALLDKENRLIPDLDPVKLLLAEYLKNRELGFTRVDAEERVNKLMNICRKNSNKPSILTDTELLAEPQSLFVDGALLVRFLATKGREL